MDNRHIVQNLTSGNVNTFEGSFQTLPEYSKEYEMQAQKYRRST